MTTTCTLSYICKMCKKKRKKTEKKRGTTGNRKVTAGIPTGEMGSRYTGADGHTDQSRSS